MHDLIAIFIGGGLGSLCRYSIGAYLLNNPENSFPWPTFVANIIGCLCFGFIFGYLERHSSDKLYLLLITGFCGGFTTYSTLTNETFHLLRHGFYYTAFTYVAATLIAGLFSLACGFLIMTHTSNK